MTISTFRLALVLGQLAIRDYKGEHNHRYGLNFRVVEGVAYGYAGCMNVGREVSRLSS